MRRSVIAGVVLAVAVVATATGAEGRRSIPTAEAFTGYVLTDGLDFPWEMLWGPDGQLWVTERHGQRITRVDPETGQKKVLATIPDAYPGPQHEGVLGMAFGPGFLEAGANGDQVFVYYTLKDKDSESRWGRVVRYRYDRARDTLDNPVIILDELPAGNDHNGGRLRLGPDGKLYLSIGEQGHNQGANFCLPIEAQRIPSLDELANWNWDAYRGKVLRMELDGGIPLDNPEIKGVRSHVFTYGHRNPQGLVFVGDALFSCEQGPSSDDEINLLESGGNYGWPHVAGFRDGMGYVYANYSQAPNCKSLQFDANIIPDGVPTQHELEWWDADFKPPVKTFYTVNNDYDFHPDSTCGPDHAYLCWPTIAPSGIIHYPEDGAIPAWRNSLLVTTLKTGALFRLPLSGNGAQLQGDLFKLFRSRNRYRVAAVEPGGRRIFIACDSGGSAKDDTGKPAGGVRNPGAILVFEYNSDGTYGYDPDGDNATARSPQRPESALTLNVSEAAAQTAPRPSPEPRQATGARAENARPIDRQRTNRESVTTRDAVPNRTRDENKTQPQTGRDDRDNRPSSPLSEMEVERL